MALLSRTEILAKRFRQYRDLDVPEWGGTVRLQTMSAAERDDFESATMLEETAVGADGAAVTTRRLNTRNIRARLVAKCLVDDAGHRCFGDDEVDQLGNEDSGVVARLFLVCQDMNGLGASGRADVEKNLPAPSAGSLSA